MGEWPPGGPGAADRREPGGREGGTKQTCWERQISLVREALESPEKRGLCMGLSPRCCLHSRRLSSPGASSEAPPPFFFWRWPKGSCL